MGYIELYEYTNAVKQRNKFESPCCFRILDVFCPGLDCLICFFSVWSGSLARNACVSYAVDTPFIGIGFSSHFRLYLSNWGKFE